MLHWCKLDQSLLSHDPDESSKVNEAKKVESFNFLLLYIPMDMDAPSLSLSTNKQQSTNALLHTDHLRENRQYTKKLFLRC